MKAPEPDVPPAGGAGWDRERGPSLVRAVWRYRWAILAVAFVCAAAGYVYASLQPTAYEAVSSIKLLNPYDRTIFRGERNPPFTDVDRYLNTQADLVKSPDVMTRASELLENQLPPGEIRQRVHAESSTTLFEVSVRAQSGDPVQAANIANAVAGAYQEIATAHSAATVEATVAELNALQASLRDKLTALGDAGNDQSVENERAILSEQLAELETTAGKIQADAAVYGAGIDRIAQAGEGSSISDTPRRMAVVFGLLGLILGLVGAFWRSERVRVIDGSDDVADVLDAPLLGELPRHPSDTPAAAAPVLTAPQSPEARQHQFIASSLALVSRDDHPRALLLTSPEASRATTVAALNLALCAAQDERTVILVDAGPTAEMTRLLGAEDRRGVADLVSEAHIGVDGVLRDCLVPVDRVGGLQLIPAGTADSGRPAAESAQMAKVLADLQHEADLLIIDGPSMLDSPGGMKLAAAVDGVVLVLSRGTPLDRVRDVRTLLALAKVPLVGYVFHRSGVSTGWWSWGTRQRPAKGRGRRRLRT